MRSSESFTLIKAVPSQCNIRSRRRYLLPRHPALMIYQTPSYYLIYDTVGVDVPILQY